MIATIITILIAFYWLLQETDWLRIRLLAGIEAPIIKYKYKTWDELQLSGNLKQYPFWIRCPDSMAPLCGWEYLKNTPHIVPECRFEFNAYGVTSKITITDTSNTKLIKDIATVAFKASKAQKSAYLSTAPTTI